MTSMYSISWPKTVTVLFLYKHNTFMILLAMSSQTFIYQSHHFGVLSLKLPILKTLILICTIYIIYKTYVRTVHQCIKQVDTGGAVYNQKAIIYTNALLQNY